MLAIRLENVTRKFGKVTALDGISLEVPQGEVYGFLGRNGAGKTTTLRILMGILRPDDGCVELLGSRVRHVSVALKRRIGYVSQEAHFYPWMTAEQLGRFVSGFYPTWDGAEFRRILRSLDVPENRRSSDLSDGTRAKLGLALALAPRPPLLLLDEPTAGLDPVARREFNDHLALLHKERGTTVFFSSHHVGEVEQLAGMVGIIQAGRLRFEGEVLELRNSVRRLELPSFDPSAIASVGIAGTGGEERESGEPEQISVTADPDLASGTAASARPNGDAGATEGRPAHAEFALPPGFEKIRGDVYRTEAAAWDQTAWPEGTRISRLTLEEIFLAFARTDDVRV